MNSSGRLEMVADGGVDGLVEPLVAAISRYSAEPTRDAAAHGALRAGDDLAGKGPTPMFSFVTKT